MTAAARILTALGAALRDRAGALLEDLTTALAGPLSDIDDLVQPGPQGWAPVYDLDETPYPSTLGVLVGTRIPAGLSLLDQRGFVRDRSRWRRGTPAAMRAAVQSVLTGTKRVDLAERDTSPWHLTVRVYEAQLGPGVDANAVAAAAGTQKPVGIILAAEVVSGASYAHMTAEHGATLADWAAAFPTYETARLHIPEEGTTP